MQLALSSDQELFRETTVKLLEELAPVAEVRRRRDDPSGFDADHWRRGAELGWTSLLVGEEHGGGTLGVSGATVATWCLGEPPPGDGLGQIALQVRPEGDGMVLDGVKRPVESATEAGHLLVTGRTGTGLTQVLVPAGTPGVSVTPMESVDMTRRFATVAFDEVRVPSTAVIGVVGGADTQVERQLQRAIAIGTAESVGAMQTAFDLTVEWAFDRYSFGRPLASYQELKHRFADMKTWLEASHAISDSAIGAVATDSPDAPELLSTAAAFIGAYGSELLQDNRVHDAKAASTLAPMAKSNAAWRPERNGAVMMDGKKLRPVSTACWDLGTWASTEDPTRCWSGL